MNGKSVGSWKLEEELRQHEHMDDVANLVDFFSMVNPNEAGTFGDILFG